MNLASNQCVRCLACESEHLKIWAKATDQEYFSIDKTYTYYKCADCQALTIDPVPDDQLSLIYPSNYYSFSTPNSLTHKLKEKIDLNNFRSLLKNIHKEQINVLDVGGGSGWLLNKIKSIDARINITQIVDIDKGAKEIAIKNGHEFFCGRIEDFRPTIKFDLCLMLNLIEHVKNPKLVLENISSLLSFEGLLLIKTPNYESLDARIFRNKNWGGFHCPRHWVIFNKESFQKLIEVSNLKVQHFQYTQGASFWAVSIIMCLGRKNIIKINKDNPALNHFLYPILTALFAGLDFMIRLFSKTSQMYFIIRKN